MRLRWILLGLCVLALGALALMYAEATRTPIVRQAAFAMPDWPLGAPPLRVALLSDIHVAGPDMPTERVAKIVERVNRLRPDLVLIAGDFTSDKQPATRLYSGPEAIAPLAALKAPLGTIAVLGNHDHWRGLAEIEQGLAAAHVRLLRNQAIAVGPLSLGGVDDAFTGSDDVPATVAAMRSHRGARVVLSHSPDVVPGTPSDVTLILAGHTHCGQIRLPLIGAISYQSKYGERFACGLSRDGPKRVVTSGGLGTSVLPLRLGAPPEIWLLTLRGAPGKR